MPLSRSLYRDRVADFLCVWWLPFGILTLLAGLLVMPDRGHYVKLYYWLILAPTLIVAFLRPRQLKGALHEPIIIGTALFSLWAIISITWSPTETDAVGLIKRPLYILILFLACVQISAQDSRLLPRVWLIAAVIVLFSTLYGLTDFLLSDRWGDERFIGPASLENPLLSSHIFGFFLIYWISCCLFCKNRLFLTAAALFCLILFVSILATGARTPLVATSLAILWLCLLYRSKQAFFVLFSAFLIFIILMVWFPETLFTRGSSHRFELWSFCLDKIKERPWIGYGLDAAFRFKIDDPRFIHTLREPHNFTLSVIYLTGIIGLIFWLFIHAWALWSSWKNRSNPLYVLASGWLVFGIGAGLTEGAGIFSRPKEHWFLVWIPLAFIAAFNVTRAHLPGLWGRELLRGDEALAAADESVEGSTRLLSQPS